MTPGTDTADTTAGAGTASPSARTEGTDGSVPADIPADGTVPADGSGGLGAGGKAGCFPTTGAPGSTEGASSADAAAESGAVTGAGGAAAVEDGPAAASEAPAPAAGPAPAATGARAAARGDDGAAPRASRRARRCARLGACALLLAVALTAGALVAGAVGEDRAVRRAAPAALAPARLTGDRLDADVRALQERLRDRPEDHAAWATLALGYVEQARVDGDPSRYPKAAEAVRRSLALSEDNEQALAARAALAAARHDFAAALADAERVLRENPYHERALCTRVDALVELGRYEEAERAAVEADDRRPGVPVFTRYAYVHELRGDTATAERVLNQALRAAATRHEVAYVATQLGHLAWHQGRYDKALRHYARALAADDAHLPALEGRARAQAAAGDEKAAVRGLEAVVARSPLPGPLVALGELYERRGDEEAAREQYALVDAWTAPARAGGVQVDLDTALAAADHGDRAVALRAARAEWERRRTVHTADALAWALHVNGRDEEALRYAREATATGYRNAAFLYHRGMIEHALGRAEDARAHLTAALELNPGFSPVGAAKARAALRELGR